MENTYLNKVRVVVADYQNFSRVLLRRTLGQLGCRRVIDAKTVKEAWEEILLYPTDLLIIDWEERVSEGLELVDRVRNAKDSHDEFMPIIMLVGQSELPRIGVARDAGVNEFILKPISLGKLSKRIDAVINQPRRFIRTKDYFGPDRRRHERIFGGRNRRKKTPDLHSETPEKNPDLVTDNAIAS
jgi:PleD family two-component response regulator